MKRAVCIVIINPKTGEYLSVSRKKRHDLIGLCGGKVELFDFDLKEAAIRELKEETGLIVVKEDLILIDSRVYGTNKHNTHEQNCFYAYNYSGDITPQHELDIKGETGKVKWVQRNVLENGFFGEYNRIAFQIIDNLKK